MRNFRQRAGASSTSNGSDLRQRRAALQAELETVGAQRERTARASSFARSRQRAGVTAHDESELGRLADETTNDDDSINDLRRRISLLDDEFRSDRTGGLAGRGRRIVSWLRD